MYVLRRTIALAVAVVLLMAPTASAITANNVERVSVAAGKFNGDPDGESSRALLSGDGRYTVFHSEADNLVTGDGRVKGVAWTDLFWVNNTTHETVMVGRQGNVFPDNQSTFPAINGDGCAVAFQSQASNLVPGVQDVSSPDVFRQVMCASPGLPPVGTIERVSAKDNGADSPGQSTRPSISDDGRWVAFNTTAPLAAGDSGTSMDVYVRDMSKAPGEAGWMTWVTAAPKEATGEDSIRAIISGDGEYVTFVSDLSTLVAGDTNNNRDVFRWHRQTQTIARASVTATGAQNNMGSTRPWIDGDGDTVVFQTVGQLTPEDTNATDDVFAATFSGPSDLTPTVRRVSLRPGGVSTTGASTRIQISGDGRWAAFASNDPRLVTGDRNRQRDVFRADLSATPPAITRVSQNLNAPPDGDDTNCPDGTSTASSTASSSTGSQDSGFVIMARPGAPELSTRPDLSNDGSVVMFVSGSCNLVPGDNNHLDDIFIRRH